MALRFRKSFKIVPGVKLNLGKNGVGLSVGRNGLRHTIHSSGRRTSTVGIPGSGVSYVKTASSGSRSYKTDAYKKRNELARREKEQQNLHEREYAQLQVELYENRLEQFRSIHHESDVPIDWEEVYNRPAPIKKGQPGPNEIEARHRLNSYQPSFFEKVFKRNAARVKVLEEDVQRAVKEDKELWKEWNHTQLIAKRILAKEIEAYFEVIQEFGPLDDLVEFGSGFEFGTDHPDLIHVSFDVNTGATIPAKALSLTKTGKLSEKNLTKTAYFELCQDYVSSGALRIARDMIALVPVSHVLVHAFEDRVNTSTGHSEKTAILSVKYDKHTLSQLNFTALDPSDALSNFEHHMKFKKTKGFEEIEVINS
ncbi:DUF4236 domain-containing protein [Mesobacillus harenae]|uniref:DUF4236 domain-containing protein n=1 Tax=Mesobacillus harenae TaxID=2213203 RepID=UPI0015804ED9|nr:DUF4236 domain-containing protein [Mesobacillus harenae]